MKCQRCNSDKVAELYGKCSDLSSFTLKDFEHDGYVMEDVGIGGGDDINFNYCLDCGQIQGKFPVDFDPPKNMYCPECLKLIDNVEFYEGKIDWWECECGAFGDNSNTSDYDTCFETKEEAIEYKKKLEGTEDIENVEGEDDHNFWN
jgi:hypothetical protein